jgi:hypothetical protein
MIHIDWGDHTQTLLVWDFEPEWTIDQFVAAVNRTRKLIRETSRTIDIIVDLRPIHIIPLSARYITRHVLADKACYQGTIIIITDIMDIQPLYEYLTRGEEQPFHIYFVNGVDKAYLVLEAVRSTRAALQGSLKTDRGRQR